MFVYRLLLLLLGLLLLRLLLVPVLLLIRQCALVSSYLKKVFEVLKLYKLFSLECGVATVIVKFDYFFLSYTLLDSDLTIVIGHSDDVTTLKAIQTIVHSMSAVKKAEDPALKSSYLSSKCAAFSVKVV